MPLTQRTCAITGVLLNASAQPVVGATIAAKLVSGSASVTVQSGAGSLDPYAVSTLTAADGSWTLNLVPPQDMSPSGLVYTITQDSTGPSPALVYTTSFAYSASARALSVVTGSSPTPVSVTAMVYDYVIDSSGLPVVGLPVIATVSQNCINLSNSLTVNAGTQISTVTDTNGYYSLNLVPTTLLSPAGVYYTITEGFSNISKTIAFAVTGGRVNNLLVTPIASLAFGANTPPPGANFVYTTPWGRQTLGLFGQWL